MISIYANKSSMYTMLSWRHYATTILLITLHIISVLCELSECSPYAILAPLCDYNATNNCILSVCYVGYQGAIHMLPWRHYATTILLITLHIISVLCELSECSPYAILAPLCDYNATNNCILSVCYVGYQGAIHMLPWRHYATTILLIM